MTEAAAARILTVEDDPIVRADLRLILEDAGYVVCPDARDGIEAIEQARRHRPDLILIDLGLPRLGGVEATRRILAERDVPVVALTGRGNLASVEEAAAAGAVRHVLKPFSERELVATLSDVFEEREATQHFYRVMIESMLREGRSEREIITELRRAGAGGEEEPGTWRRLGERVAAFGRRLSRS